jgi:hypothetical protein
MHDFQEGFMPTIGKSLTFHKITKQIDNVGKAEVCQAKDLKLESL